LVARCIFWLLVGALLFFLFVFARKRFRQVVLIGGLSLVSGVIIRLFSLRSSDQSELVSEAYFLIGIGILYGLVWLATRYLVNRPRSSTPRPPKT
jgi:hypothetical protein